MEVYASVLFFLTTSIVIVSSRSIRKLVAESDKDLIAGISLKAHVKNKNSGNDVRVHVETLIDPEDLRKIMYIVLHSPYYNNEQVKVETTGSKVPVRMNEDIQNIFKAKGITWQNLMQRIRELKELRSGIENFLQSDYNSGETGSERYTNVGDDDSSIILSGPNAVFKDSVDLLEQLLRMKSTQLNTDKGERTMSLCLGRTNLLRALLRVIEEHFELAGDHPVSDKKVSEYFDMFSYVKNNFQSNEDPLDHGISELVESIKNLKREIPVYKLRTVVDKLVEHLQKETNDPLPISPSKYKSEYQPRTVDHNSEPFNITCTSLPIGKELVSAQEKNAKQKGALIKNPAGNPVPHSKKLDDKEPEDVGKNIEVELIDATSLGTRPSLEQQIKEDKEEHLHGTNNGKLQRHKSGGNGCVKGHHTADGNAAKTARQHKGKNKRGGNADPFEKVVGALRPKTSVRKDSKPSGNNRAKNATVLKKECKKHLGDNPTSESERASGKAMEELITTVHKMFPPPEKSSASKLKLKSSRLLTRSNYRARF